MQYPTATQAGTFTVEQNKVLRNTYMMLALTMIPTVIGAFVGMSTNFSFMAESPIMSALLMFGAMMGIPIIAPNISSADMIGLSAMNEKFVDMPTNAPITVGIMVSASIM